jgi:hypothetical protein
MKEGRKERKEGRTDGRKDRRKHAYRRISPCPIRRIESKPSGVTLIPGGRRGEGESERRGHLGIRFFTETERPGMCPTTENQGEERSQEVVEAAAVAAVAAAEAAVDRSGGAYAGYKCVRSKEGREKEGKEIFLARDGKRRDDKERWREEAPSLSIMD